ncbi:MAG: hypothetical protein CL927_11365 [Deltaproteobacteria bacterium]|nr:hypothetical protein [Deltaproteobacteria bacterium]HCH61559.1 hypothetical protein [Deltaproteobacteria bacterium]
MDIIRRNDSPQASDEQVRGLPGCGLAAYTMLLAFLCLLGMAGMAGGFIGVLFQDTNKGPLPLQPGTQTAVWALAPMRSVNILAVDEIPLAYHAEESDASVACAMLDDRLIRVDGEQGITLPYAQIDDITTTGSESTGVTVTARGTTNSGPGEVTCTFQANEGGDKFDRQLRSEHRRTAAK